MKDHFEVNVVPLSIGVTQSFYNKIMEFLFPEEPLAGSADDDEEEDSSRLSEEKSIKEVVVGGAMVLPSDDVEQMRERAKLNKLFTYIKIPAVPICVSFRGDKTRKGGGGGGAGAGGGGGGGGGSRSSKILDVENFVLQVPMLEYHNVTWTWLDFLMAVKSQTKDSLLSQAIKKKLTLSVLARRRSTKRVSVIGGGGGGGGVGGAGGGDGANAGSGRSEKEKSKMLLGDLS